MNDSPFAPLPADEEIVIAWPTPNHWLFTEPGRFFARTRVNPDYGRPGWTRDCGRRLHRGCDIAPVRVTATGDSARVTFTDCATGVDFDSDEPAFTPHDDVFAVWDGIVAEVVTDPATSDFGIHVVLEHRWPRSGEKFYTLYGHLNDVNVQHSTFNVQRSRVIGQMGQTSRSAAARNWMRVAPHLHFEVRRADGARYDPEAFLRRFLPRA